MFEVVTVTKSKPNELGSKLVKDRLTTIPQITLKSQVIMQNCHNSLP